MASCVACGLDHLPELAVWQQVQTWVAGNVPVVSPLVPDAVGDGEEIAALVWDRDLSDRFGLPWISGFGFQIAKTPAGDLMTYWDAPHAGLLPVDCDPRAALSSAHMVEHFSEVLVSAWGRGLASG